MRATRICSTLLASLLIALTPAGCESEPVEESVSIEPAPQNVLPASLFVETAPTDAVPLIDAKTGAKPGDRVAFQARVGGRGEAFLENRAVFFVADPSLKSCADLHGDRCKTPWDYCCEPQDNLLKHMATVQVVDAAGQPLKVSLHHQHGLDGLRLVCVTGTVDQVDEAGTFVVNAETIHVIEG